MTQSQELPPSLAAAREAHIREHGTAAPDLTELRSVIDGMVPFCNLVGVRVTELRADGAVAELPDRADLLNHMGTIHAGAIFLAAEVSGAAAFSGAIAPRILQVRSFLLRDCRTSFLRPARGRIRAHGTVDVDIVRAVAARSADERFDLTGRSLVYDDEGTLLAKVDFDYAAWVTAA